MPKQFLKGIDLQAAWPMGSCSLTCGSWRRVGRDPEFILNREPWRERAFPGGRAEFRLRLEPRARGLGAASIGIRALIGTSSPAFSTTTACATASPHIVLPANDVERLLALTADGRARSQISTVDLPRQTIRSEATGEQLAFPFDPNHKEVLLRGQSAVQVTLQDRASIESFERAYYARCPWLA